MLAFPGKMNNDNPVSDDLDLASLHTFWYAMILFVSNIPGFHLVVYSHKMTQYALAVLCFIAVFCSLLYHLCQTTDVCFGMCLPTLTLLDHISAPVFMIALILFFINSSSSRQIRRRLRVRYAEEFENQQQQQQQQQHRVEEFAVTSMAPLRSLTLAEIHKNVDRCLAATNPNVHFNGLAFAASKNVTPTQPTMIVPTNNPHREPREPWHDEDFERSTQLTDEEFDYIEGSKLYYNYGYGNGEPNTLTSAWDVYILMTSIFIAIIAALAHPFSMQAFLIVINFNLLSIFFKIVVIEEGVPVNMYDRLYLPDLLLGIGLISLSLVFYILDCYWAYAYTHTLWHILSFIGSVYVVSGLSRNLKNWYSPQYLFYRSLTRCCLREKDLDSH